MKIVNKDETIELIKNSNLTVVKPTKRLLKEILKWTSSKYNEYTKEEVINIIFKRLSENSNCFERFTVGTFTEKNGHGIDYIFIKEGNEAYLINQDNLNNMVYKLK